MNPKRKHIKAYERQQKVLGGKFMAIVAYTNKEERSQINSFTLNLEELEKEEEIKPKVSKKK